MSHRGRSITAVLLVALLRAVAASAPASALPAAAAGTGAGTVGAAASGAFEPDFRGWREARTDHFVFVYEPRDAASVAELTSFAESVYREVTSFFDSYPKRVWVVVNGRIDAANGDFYPLPPHLDLYLTAPSEPLIGLSSSEWLRMLLTHELTHYVHLDYDSGFFAALSRVLGPGFASGDGGFLPGWMIEGIAVNTETLFTQGGRGRDPFFEMQYKALVLDRRFISLGHAGYESSFPPYGRIYLAGYLFVHYLLEHYGRDAFTRIHREYVKFPLLGPWGAIERVTGKSADELYGALVEELEHRYEPYRAIEAGARVSPRGTSNYYLPVVTAQGWYLYRWRLDEPAAIVRFDPASGLERVLLRTGLTDHASLTASADGTKIVFATIDQRTGRSGSLMLSDLFALDPATRAVRRITTGAHLWQPLLSPDGRRLYAVQGVGPYSRLVEVDEASGRVRVLFSIPETNVLTPAISPDGATLAFELESGGDRRIWVMDARAATAPVEGDRVMSAVNAALARPLGGAGDTGSAGAYYPRFIGNDRLLFSSARSIDGRAPALALYETRIGDRAASLACEDPVGAYAGVPLADGSIIYGSYRADGYVLASCAPMSARSRAVTPAAGRAGAPTAGTPAAAGAAATAVLPAATAALPAEAAAPAVAPGAIGAVPPGGGERYLDLPRFQFWLPVPLYLSPIGAQESPYPFGVGALLYGASLLGRSSYTAAVTVRTDLLQPAAELSVTGSMGRASLSYTLSAGYGATAGGLYRQEADQQALVAFPLVSESLLERSSGLTLSVGLADTLALSGSAPFTIADELSGRAALSPFHALGVVGGISVARSRADSVLDLFPRHAFDASANLTFYPPLVSDTGIGADASASLELVVPSPIPHESLRLGLLSSYTTQAGSFAPSVNPRGLFDPGVQSLPGRSLAAIDYLATIAILDQPLPLGLNLQGLGTGLHLEAAADWDAAAARFVPDRFLYAGIELVSLVGYNDLPSPLPFGIGVALRFDPTFATPVDVATDVRPYLFVSLDSFASLGLAPAIRARVH